MPPGATVSTAKLAEDVTNRYAGADRAAFGYDSDSLSEITTIGVTLFVDVSPTMPPAETELSSAAFLRNQNQVPVAAFTDTATGAGHLLLNAGGSSDPDNQQITFKWLLVTGTEEVDNRLDRVARLGARGWARGVHDQTSGHRFGRLDRHGGSHGDGAMRKLSADDGFALVPAITVMMVVLLLGTALLTKVNAQTSQSATERAQEGSFQLADGALTAQLEQLEHTWPGSGSPYSTCDQSATSSATCMGTELAANYTALAAGSPNGGADFASDPQWSTRVIDDADGPEFYDDDLAATDACACDENGNG